MSAIVKKPESIANYTFVDALRIALNMEPMYKVNDKKADAHRFYVVYEMPMMIKTQRDE